MSVSATSIPTTTSIAAGSSPESSSMLPYKFTQPGNYNFLKSTEDNYKASTPVFVGKYQEQRRALDYSYHTHYTPERQYLHDQLIDLFHATRVHDQKTNSFCEAPLENWIVFTAGPMGAGKSHTINWLQHHNLFPLDAFVRVDPDQIRELLPEISGYNARDTSQTGYLTQREVGYISEVLTMIALEAGKNAIVDSSMRDAAWFAKYFDCLHERFPKLKIAILSIEANPLSIFQRANKRAKVTGRLVPERVIWDALERVPRTVEFLRPKVDFFARIVNEDGADPVVTECEQHRRTVDFLQQDGVYWRMLRTEVETGAEPSQQKVTSERDINIGNNDQKKKWVYRKHIITRTHHDSDTQNGITIRDVIEEDIIKEHWLEEFAMVWVMECPIFPPSTNNDVQSNDANKLDENTCNNNNNKRKLDASPAEETENRTQSDKRINDDELNSGENHKRVKVVASVPGTVLLAEAATNGSNYTADVIEGGGR